MADDKEVQEQTIADEAVLKKYKEAGEIVNSEYKAKIFSPKNSTRQRNFSIVFLSINEPRFRTETWTDRKVTRLSKLWDGRSRSTFSKFQQNNLHL